MKLEKLPSGSYRAKKIYKGKTYRVTFDHKPTDQEALIALAEVMQEEAPREKGTFGTYAKRYIESKRNILSPASAATPSPQDGCNPPPKMPYEQG